MDELKIHTTDAMEFSLEVAGIGSRSYAFVIDWHIRLVLALTWLVAFWLLLAGTQIEALIQTIRDDSAWIGYLILVPPLALYLLYHPILEILMHGRTPGKRMAGVRIVTTDGQTPGTTALLIRNVFRLIDSLPVFYALGFVVAILTKTHVRIGDLAAGTLLVHEERVTSTVLERATQLALDQSLAPQDQELLLDLLERWKKLQRQVRTSLGLKFIRKIDKEVPEGLSPRELDRTLYHRLRKLAGQA